MGFANWKQKFLNKRNSFFFKYLNRKKNVVCLFVCSSWIRKSLTLFKVIYLSPMAKRDGEREWQRAQHQGRRRKKREEKRKGGAVERKRESLFFSFFFFFGQIFFFLFPFLLFPLSISNSKNFNSFEAILPQLFHASLVSIVFTYIRIYIYYKE